MSNAVQKDEIMAGVVEVHENLVHTDEGTQTSLSLRYCDFSEWRGTAMMVKRLPVLRLFTLNLGRPGPEGDSRQPGKE